MEYLRGSRVLLLAALLLVGLLPAVPAQAQQEETKLTASDGSAGELFGISVALSSDGQFTLIGVSSDYVDGNSKQGSAYVFARQSDGSYTQEAKLTASDGGEMDRFGNSVSISADGQHALVGAHLDEQGSAYVFARQSDGSYTQEAKLTASDGGEMGRFGNSVSISADGQLALVGARLEDEDSSNDQARAYVFARQSDGSYTQEAKLTASDGEAYDDSEFSATLSSDGQFALLGAGPYSVNGNSKQGSAYVFARQSDGSYTQEAKLTASDGDAFDFFGGSVSISADGQHALVGAHEDEVDGNDVQGSAYVFARQSDGSYTQEAKLTASDGEASDDFGFSVSINSNGQHALVGAGDYNNIGTSQGSAYVFAHQSDGSYTQEAKLTASDGEASDDFGFSVSINSNGQHALVGAPVDDVDGNDDQGSAYVYDLLSGPDDPLASTFSYPVGDKVNLPERITPEANDLYPDNPEADPKRESSDVGPYWRNAQDVGNYLGVTENGTVIGGIHAGEDWNFNAGADDRGKAVYATANGQVLGVRTVSDVEPSAGGYAVIIEHEVPSGETYYSLYLHVVDGSSTEGEIEPPSISGTVEKGQLIARIGDVTAYPTHLHFEIRDTNWDPSGPLYPNANPNGYYSHDGGVYTDGMTAQQVADAFSLMRQDGLLDASDFIDARSQGPSGLTTTSDDNEVSLSWNSPPDGDPNGYNVYRSTSSFNDLSNADKINNSLIASQSYTDSEVDSGTTYYYRVTAVSTDGTESGPSGQASVSIQSLQLLGLEVNQSVQTWENDIMPLVEGKETIVRVHLQNKGEGSTPVQVKLKGTQDGSPLPDSPKSAYNADNYEAPPSPSEDSVETIRKRRADMDSTLNFELPSEWLEGTVTLSLEGGNIDCDETPAVNTDCELQVTFEPVATPKIKFFEIHWVRPSGVRKPEYDIDKIVDRVKNMYPVSDFSGVDKNIESITMVPLFGGDVILTVDAVLERLREKFDSDLGGEKIDQNYIYYGLVKDVIDPFLEDGMVGGSANISGNVAFTRTEDNERVAGSTAHELGHVLGLQHAANADSTNGEGRPVGWCGASAEPGTRNFPYVSDNIDIPEELNWKRYTAMGPTDQGLSREVWGVNTKKKEVVATSQHVSGDPNGELMSYCQLGIRWASDTTYTALQDSIGARFDAGGGGPMLARLPRQSSDRTAEIQASSQEDEKYLLAKGRINLEEDSLGFRSFTTMTTTPARAEAIAPESGGYTLQALDGSGSVVEAVSFEPRIGVSKTFSNIGIFTVPIQADPSIEEVQVLGGGGENSLSTKSGPSAPSNSDVLGSKSASPNPPTVTVQYPNGGEDLGGNEVTLEWTADDADGDSLSYTVKYSRNGGSTWKALATSWPRDSLTVDASALGGTSNGLIRVQASDGFNTAEDQSDAAFGTSNVPPSASIFSPSDGAVTGQGGLITLDGSASDTEDGSLSGPALKWRTASGDSLGIDKTIDVSAANFSLGTHTIELVATDSVGASDTASVSIQVALSNDPSLLASTSSLVESDSLHDFGATGTNIDFTGTIGAATVTVELYDSAPIGVGGIPQSNVSKYRVLIGAGNGLTVGQGTEVRFEADTLGGINDPTKVQIYRRPAPSNGPFNALDTQVDSMGTPEDPSDDEIYATVDGLGEFVLASNSQPLPVELSDFDATLDGQDAVRLTWATAQETGNAGFRVQRNAGEGGEGTWTTVGSVEGGGTTTEAKNYRYVDENLPYEADRLTYRLRQVDTDGSASYSKEVTVEREVKEAQLLGTYPNPATQSATVRYALPERQDIKIYLYDVLGRRIQTVVEGEREGRHKRQLDVSRLASGVYFLRLQSEGQTRTQKLTVVR